MSEHTYSAEFASGACCTLTLSGTSFRAEWTPAFPRRLRGAKRDRFLETYRAWRNECVADFARRTGMKVTVIDL